MTDLNGRVALVTGGGGGLGRAICLSLAGAGAVVVPADVRFEAASAVAREVVAAGGSAEPMRLDVCDVADADLAVDRVVQQLGRLDVLVNCAGIDVTVPVEDLSSAEWDRILGVNLRAPFVLSRQAFVVMKRQHGGHVVNIVSTAAKRAWANASAYHASKWGLLGLSHALHVEGRPHGVKVTAVIAGGMRTPFILERFPETDPAVLQDPRNVAETIRFILCQPEETVIPEVTVIPMRETSWP
jgi:NAD(P)-dependent dehydrogenase (short-subunit alcohol dehydrogenase family)